MGNHEYCVDCGLSSFHFGEPCPPEAYARQQAENKAIEVRISKADALALKTIKHLKTLGYKAELGSYGDVEISKWSLTEKSGTK
jgi:hypothetical protein